MDHVWTFAVIHHGFFTCPTNAIRPAPFILSSVVSGLPSTPNEKRRITLVDLLFAYHPLGGLVMIGDLMASYCHEQGRD